MRGETSLSNGRRDGGDGPRQPREKISPDGCVFGHASPQKLPGRVCLKQSNRIFVCIIILNYNVKCMIEVKNILVFNFIFINGLICPLFFGVSDSFGFDEAVHRALGNSLLYRRKGVCS